MDLLYSRYASPHEFMNLYIEQGRFGEFVGNIVDLENRRRKEQAEEESDRMLWEAYIHSGSEMNFSDYKKAVLYPPKKKDASMSYKEIGSVINESKRMLSGFKPE